MRPIRTITLLGVSLAVTVVLALAPGLVEAKGGSGNGKGAETYSIDGWRDIAGSVCGVPVSGRLHEVQQFTLTPNGQVNFHYIANGRADGSAPDGHSVKLLINNMEIDHLVNGTGPWDLPDLTGQTLQQWVEANFSDVVEIFAQYNERWVGQKNGRQLQNHASFHVNLNGVQFDAVRFTIDCP